MIINLSIGLENKLSRVVSKEDTAANFGEEHMPVLATSKIVAFMEYVALSSLEGKLPKGYSSLGASINLNHLKPALAGDTLTCHSVLTETRGRKLFFEISLRSEAGLIASASHTRVIINNEAFRRLIKRNNVR